MIVKVMRTNRFRAVLPAWLKNRLRIPASPLSKLLSALYEGRKSCELRSEKRPERVERPDNLFKIGKLCREPLPLELNPCLHQSDTVIEVIDRVLEPLLP